MDLGHGTAAPPLYARFDGFAWGDRRIVYAVREPFATHFTGARDSLRRSRAESVILESEMSDGGAMLSDGIVEDSVRSMPAPPNRLDRRRQVRLVTEATRPRVSAASRPPR